MTQTEKLAQATKLLKELNCPEDIMGALEIWGWFVHDDEIKLHNWVSPPIEAEDDNFKSCGCSDDENCPLCCSHEYIPGAEECDFCKNSDECKFGFVGWEGL